jgi:hypothetical protein
VRKPPRKAKLNTLLVQRVRPAAKPFLIWDTRQAGLALAVQPTGARAYKVIYRSGGRPRWLTLGSARALSLTAARELAAEALLAVARGKDPAAEKRALRGAGTFGELATRYVADYAKRHNRSWLQADRLVRRNLLPRWGKLQAGYPRGRQGGTGADRCPGGG